MQTGISRTIVHAGLVELAARGVLTISPRKGAFVADYRREGPLELYSALAKYSGSLDEGIFRSLAGFRGIVETACARLAAENGTSEDAAALRALLEKERAAVSIEDAVRLDYELHIRIAASTGDIILPMAMRSMEELYKALVARFYAALANREDVYRLQEELIGQIERRRPREAEEAMRALLEHGKQIVELAMESPSPGV